MESYKILSLSDKDIDAARTKPTTKATNLASTMRGAARTIQTHQSTCTLVLKNVACSGCVSLSFCLSAMLCITKNESSSKSDQQDHDCQVFGKAIKIRIHSSSLGAFASQHKQQAQGRPQHRVFFSDLNTMHHMTRLAVVETNTI